MIRDVIITQIEFYFCFCLEFGSLLLASSQRRKASLAIDVVLNLNFEELQVEFLIIHILATFSKNFQMDEQLYLLLTEAMKKAFLILPIYSCSFRFLCQSPFFSLWLSQLLPQLAYCIVAFSFQDNWKVTTQQYYW